MSTSQGEMHRREARRWVAHVDMDAFFASVEQLDDPLLSGKPVLVANSPLTMERLRELAAEARLLPHRPERIKGIRGVVASASYEARAFGVRSAMPLARALVLCPDACVLSGRFTRYREVARRLREIWSEFSPIVEPMSLDEAYLDLTGMEQSVGPVRVMGTQLKARIRAETGLTASVGIAPNKLVAKIASDLQKPDGLVVIQHGQTAQTLAPLHVRTLPGVGPRTADVLKDLGITTLGHLAAVQEGRLLQALGADHARSLLLRAAGIDNAPVEVPGDPKSISKETTLSEDEGDLEKLKSLLRGLSDSVAWTLRGDGFHARCVYIKLRLLPTKRTWSPDGSGFGRLITRRTTLAMPTESGETVYRSACSLLESAFKGTGLGSGREIVRLLGVGVASLVTNSDLDVFGGQAKPQGFTPLSPQMQFDLTPPTESVREPAAILKPALDASMDSIRKRFGFRAISFGASIGLRDADDGWRSVEDE